MDQQNKTISERKQRKLDLKSKEKEELIRQEADEKVNLFRCLICLLKVSFIFFIEYYDFI